MKMPVFFKQLIETGQFSITEDGHALLFGEFVILMPSGVFLQMVSLLEKETSKKKAHDILMKLGEFQLEAAVKRYEKRYDIQSADKRKIITFLFDILNILGWGTVEIEELSFDKRTVRVIVKNGVLGEKYRMMYGKKNKEPVDFYLAGWLRRTFELIFGQKMNIKETKCIAKGDKYCEFLIKSRT